MSNVRWLGSRLIGAGLFWCAVGFAGCGNDDAGFCSANFELTVSDEAIGRANFCEARAVAASFEFDFDRPPEPRSLRMRLYASQNTEVDCYVDIVLSGPCSPGVYPVDGLGNSVRMVTNDCVGVPDSLEGDFFANSGYVRLDLFSAGGEPGFFVGEPIETRARGYVAVYTPGGFGIRGPFDIVEEVTGVDSEGSVCAIPLGNSDGDNEIGVEFGGSDCDDRNPLVNSGAAESCNGIDDDCDTAVDEGCGSSAAPVGAACAGDPDCGAGLICFTEADGWPGGMCTRLCEDGTCPPGASCVSGATVAGNPICLANCPPACRTDYICTSVESASFCL